MPDGKGYSGPAGFYAQLTDPRHLKAQGIYTTVACRSSFALCKRQPSGSPVWAWPNIRYRFAPRPTMQMHSHNARVPDKRAGGH